MTQNQLQRIGYRGPFSRSARALAIVALVLLLGDRVALAAPSATATFTPVGFLPGDDFSSVNAANDAGTLAACLSYHRDPVTLKRVYTAAGRWTPGEGMQPLPLLSDTPNAQDNPFNASISGRDVTNDGTRIIYTSHTTAGNVLAVGIADFDGGNVLNLTALPNGDKLTTATQLSDDGNTAFGYRLGGVSGFASIGAVWTATGGVEALVPPDGFAEVHPALKAISADGSVSVGMVANTDVNGVYLDLQAYRWTASGGVQGLGYLPGDDRSEAYAVTPDGTTILGSSYSSSGTSTLVLWSETGGMTELNSPQIPFYSTLTGGGGISADGQLIMVSGYIQRLDYPFYFAIDDLLVEAGAGSAIEGWSSFSVNGLSGDGNTVWGQATNPAGRPEGFIATFPANYFRTLVAPMPEITSVLTDVTTLNEGYSYLIEATGMPESFGATDLPPGMTLQTGSYLGLKVGIISGTPTFPGVYTIPISATNIAGTAHATLTLTVQYPLYLPRLLNISTRTNVLTGDQVLIAGFIIPEGAAKNVILRAIGPSLATAGVSGALADPALELFYPDGTTVSNDNWEDSQKSEIEATSLSPSNSKEAAIVASLDPGSYTAIVSGKDGATGIGLVEAYDLDDLVTSRMANISTRGFVGTEDNVLIGGIIVGGIVDARVIVRAIGPSLEAAGVAGALLDPLLEIHNVDGSILASNDNWRETQEADIQASGFAPGDERESAILATLPANGYTAIVRGKDGTTGVGLVEVYNLD